MKLLNERNQIIEFIKQFKISVARPTLGNARWSKSRQLEILGKLEFLDPLVCTKDDLIEIFDDRCYIGMHIHVQECSECGETGWECVQFSRQSICKECMKFALLM